MFNSFGHFFSFEFNITFLDQFVLIHYQDKWRCRAKKFVCHDHICLHLFPSKIHTFRCRDKISKWVIDSKAIYISTSNTLEKQCQSIFMWLVFPIDTGRKLNAHKTFRRRPGRLLNVLCTFSLRPVFAGLHSFSAMTKLKFLSPALPVHSSISYTWLICTLISVIWFK